MNDRILWDIIDGLRDELNIAQDGITDLNEVVKDLQAEAIEQIKDNNSFHGQFDEIQELKAEVERYKFHAETRANELVKRGAKLKELQADNVRLVEQVSSNRDNSSSTHTHTISKEIDEYMDHNDKCKGARMYILPIESFNDGLYDGGYLCWDDGME